MIVKKSGGKIFGAALTAAERKALQIEIERQTAKFDREHLMEIEAMIFLVLHEEFGFGKDRLKRFHDKFGDRVKDLFERYQMDPTDADERLWLCTRKLKDAGIDISEW